MCLVDMAGGRRQATISFLRGIENDPLISEDGEREFMAVYDWRVLEAVMDSETLIAQGKDINVDPWRRWHVGYV